MTLEETAALIRAKVWQKCCMQYKQPLMVYGLSQKVHRFGFSTYLNFSEPIAEQKSYIWGLLIIPIIAAIFFVLWTVACVILTCLGPDRVGFWSGRKLVAIPSSDDTSSSPPTKRCCKPHIHRPRRLRIAFLSFSILLLVWIILLVVLGFHKFEQAINSGYNSTKYLQNTLSTVISFQEQMILALETLQETAIPEVSNAFNACVSNLGNGVTNITDLEFVYRFDDYIQSSVDTFTSFYQSLLNANSTNANAQSTLVKVSNNYYYHIIYWIPLLCFVVFLLGYLVFIWRGHFNKKLECIKSYIILPLFFLWITISWVASLAVFVGASANSDVCSGTGPNGHFSYSPAGTIATFISTEFLNETERSLILQIAEYYIGCNNPFPAILSDQWAHLEDIVSNITNVTGIEPLQGEEWHKVKSALENVTAPLRNRRSLSTSSFDVKNFLSQLRTDLSGIGSGVRPQLVIECGSNIAQAIIDLWLSVVVVITVLYNFLPDLQAHLQCSSGLSPAYNTGVNEAACQSSPVGLGWITVGLAVVAILGLTMITLRSALLPVEVQETPPMKGNEIRDGLDESVDKLAVPIVDEDDVPSIKVIDEERKGINPVDDSNSTSIKEVLVEDEGKDADFEMSNAGIEPTGKTLNEENMVCNTDVAGDNIKNLGKTPAQEG